MLRWVCAVAAAFLSSSTLAANPAGIRFDLITIAQGRLIIVGSTDQPGWKVTVPGTRFVTRSNADGDFSFNIDYRTPNCRVTLATQAGVVTPLIANCGPQGKQGLVGPKGPAGARGSIGPAGPRGFAGPVGPRGLTGPRGIQGPRGPRGLQGPVGPGITVAQGELGPGVNVILPDDPDFTYSTEICKVSITTRGNPVFVFGRSQFGIDDPVADGNKLNFVVAINVDNDYFTDNDTIMLEGQYTTATVSLLETPTAGTHTYSYRAVKDIPGEMRAFRCHMMAFELPNSQ